MANDVPVEFLDLEDLLYLAGLLFRNPPIRDAGLLEGAAARPKASVLGSDAYPDLHTKAAALLQSIVKGQALVDGNKRLGWLATAVFLEINRRKVTPASNNDVYDLVSEAAAGSLSVDEIAARLRKLTHR